jgi:hypothetical protein
MKHLRRNAALTALLLSASALLLSGCATFASPPVANQNQVIGSVRISFTVCASQPGGFPLGSCANTGNSSSSPFSSPYASSGPSQLFLGFRIPSGATAPQSFSSTATGPTDSGPQLQFTKNDSYRSELQRLDPAPAGEEWVGYTSQYVSYDTAGDQNFSADVDFGLPEHADGSPFVGPFTYQAVVGGRQYGTDPTEPIDCQSSLTDSWGGPGSATEGICVDDPAAADLDTDSSLETRDAGITPGAAASVVQGGTVTVPFTFAYAGTATPEASFAFAATTNVPGAAATPSISKLEPTADSSTVAGVSVAVPQQAAPGTYSVTLTARLSDGESRTGTAVLVVSAAPITVPAVKVAYPVNTSSPSVSGKRRQDQILSASRGAWANHSTSFSYSWQRCKSSTRACLAISRADMRRYRLKAADIGSQLRVLVTATNANGSARAVSARTSPIGPRLGSRPEIREAMSTVLAPQGAAAAIPALLEHDGYAFSFHSPAAGRLLICWYLKSARSDEQVLVARASAAFSSAKTARIKLALTAQGRELLAQADELELVGSGRFAQTGKQRVVTVEKKLTLER